MTRVDKTTVDDLEDILLDGEELLWSGRPDWDRAKPVRSVLRQRATVLLFAAGFGLTAASLIWIGSLLSLQGFASAVAAVCVGILFVASGFTLLSAFEVKKDFLYPYSDEYAITNKRLIIRRPESHEEWSLTKGAVCYLVLKPNGDVFNLELYPDPGDHNFHTLYALSDANVAKKLALEIIATEMEAS